jgi:hypothetical protein
LTGIIPVIYEAMNVVSRERVGLISACTIDAAAARAAVGQTVRSPVGAVGAMEDIVPGQMPANTGGTTTGYKDIVVTKSKAMPILWNGEEELSVGGMLNPIMVNQFAEAMRALTNAIEVDLAVTAVTHASRAYGTAGTAPFGTAGDLSDFAGVLKILEDNGAPQSDLQIGLNSGAIANLRGKQSVLFKVNEAGSNDMLRNGMTDRVQGFALRNSAGLKLHTKGTGASYLTNGAAAAGATVIAVDTGTGTILAGDVVTFGSDTTKYVVTGALSSGNITIALPGLLADVADGATVTVGGNYTPNVAFARPALVLAARAPALPTGGDAAVDRTTVEDPITGMSFEVSLYRQYRQVKYEVSCAWGTASVKDEHIGILLG